MRRFCELYEALDRTTRTNVKVEALARYFREADPADAAWALAVLTGRKLIRAIPARDLRRWAGEAAGYPNWLVDECHAAVGDLSETLALLLPDPPASPDGLDAPGAGDQPLHRIIEECLLPLPGMDDASRRRSLMRTWRQLTAPQRFVFHKLISGALRVGASTQLVVRALADIAEVEPAVMAHRLAGPWTPDPADLRRLLAPDFDPAERSARPYPFFLASALESPLSELGPVEDWQVEWKWDGVRAQILRRADDVMVWSRGEELITPAFPELEAIARDLPDGTVIDGEILAWDQGQPLPFHQLQRCLNRKRVQPMLFPETPIVLIAYDLLERDGEDARHLPLAVRRNHLRELVADLGRSDLMLSPTVTAQAWSDLDAPMASARDRGVEGLMIKRLSSPYGVGRQRGDWWKLKVDPWTIDAVMVQAMLGHGRRAGLYTDYTFAVWREGKLTPVARAYSGLTDEEIREVDRWVRRNTVARHGPVRVVKPELVFELGFEGVQASNRHKAGLALRFPRMLRRRLDKKPQDADQLDALTALLA